MYVPYSVSIPGAHKRDSLHGHGDTVPILVTAVVVPEAIHHLVSPALDKEEAK